jgi:DNA polymerase III subunit epsilon
MPPVAFVDVETTGLDPRSNRITEIGVVTLDQGTVAEWSTLVNPLLRSGERTESPVGVTDAMRAEAPRFRDVANELARRLAGRLFIAHNARFDYAFLRTEFGRSGIEFHPAVLCSLMLSRKLYPTLPHHDLDSLMERHALESEVRHRALHDAKLVHQFWQVIHREHPPQSIATAIDALLTGPVLPAHLDPGLIDRLPETPGVYVFHGERSEMLASGTANNLRLHVRDYFRIDHASSRAIAISHRIRNITWRSTQGMLGAELQRALLSSNGRPSKPQASRDLCSWRFDPDAYPSVSLTSLAKGPLAPNEESFGAFESPLKARNALHRIATRQRLCHSLLGIPETAGPCLACPIHRAGAACGLRTARLRHLTRAFNALRPLRLPPWPFSGPVGLRERSDLHIVDAWRYLGTARDESEIHAALETRTADFDARIFALLAKSLRRLPRSKIVCLSENAGGRAFAGARYAPQAHTAEKVFPTCAVPSSS